MEMNEDREVKELVRRAASNPDKSGIQRREALKKLIVSSHSGSPALKILAAGNIPSLFNDFPELEEEAINAIYDLCEDQSPQVRIKGYAAISRISDAQNKWIKRNADVLLQLLQSDEPDEVLVVKKALTEHLDMDPKVTLGVLCDQIVPPDEGVDEEEKQIRDRLRELVLSFLSGEAKRTVIRHAVAGSPSEELLLSSLLTAIPKLNFNTVNVIVKDLLLSLPSYHKYSPRGQVLLGMLLEKIKPCLDHDLHSRKPAELTTARPYLQLAGFIVLESKTAFSCDLLQYYCNSLIGKIFLQKLEVDDRLWVIHNLADVLAFCKENPENDERFMLLKSRIVEACPFLLETLLFTNLSQTRSANACQWLLDTCIARKQSSTWIVPPNLVRVLEKLDTEINVSFSEDLKQKIQERIRALAPAKLPVVPSNELLVATFPPSDTNATNSAFTYHIHGNNGHPQMNRSLLNQRQQATNPLSSHPSYHPADSASRRAFDESQRAPKRRKGSDRVAGLPEPSLLSRLHSSSPQLVQTFHASLDDDGPPGGEWSIKGAARATGARFPPRLSAETPSQSLLDRLQDVSSRTVTEDRFIPSDPGKRKRGTF